MPVNPYGCGDSSCILHPRDMPRGQCTNGGCRCVDTHMTTEERIRLRRAILWLQDHYAPTKPSTKIIIELNDLMGVRACVEYYVRRNFKVADAHERDDKIDEIMDELFPYITSGGSLSLEFDRETKEMRIVT